MKIVADTKVFADAVATVSKIVERRNTYPILANVLLKADDGRVTLRATDLDIEITLEIEAATKEPGVTTVEARLLADILRKFPKGSEVTLAAAGEAVNVACGRSRFNLATLSPDSFPDLKTGTFPSKFSISGAALAAILETVRFAISTEETRYYLNGIYLHTVERQGRAGINFVATDGHRMAQRFHEIEVEGPMPGIIVPRKTVGELIRLASDAGESEICVECSDTKLRITAGRVTLLSKLIEGTFPDYDRVTPKNNNNVAIVDVEPTVGALGRVGTIATDRGGKAVKMVLQKGEATLEVTNRDHGSASEEIPIEIDPELDLTVGFNLNYLGDILGVIGRGHARIALNDPGSPALIWADGDEDARFVLMPMRV